MNKLFRKRALVISGIALLILVLILAPITFSKPELPENADLLRMITSIESSTNDINTTNREIAAKMGDIRDVSGTTARIGAGLTELEAGIGEQDASLAHLGTLSKRQVDLSVELKDLATRLHTDLGTLQASTERQKAAVRGMNDAGKSLTSTAQEIKRINEVIADDVRRAERLAAETANNMP